jgi:SP family sugar:H+ symporter-like MFS transporter
MPPPVLSALCAPERLSVFFPSEHSLALLLVHREFTLAILFWSDIDLMSDSTADRFGRRKAMVIQCILFIIGVIIQITASHSWAQVAVGRLISGLGVGGLSSTVPLYQAEAAPPQIRGTLTATYQLFITFGILIAYAVSIGTRNIDGSGSWRTVIGIGLLWPIIRES